VPEILKNRIGEVRSARKLSQPDLAARSGLSVFTLQKIEQGQVSPGVDKAMMIARALDLNVEDIFLLTSSQEFLEVSADIAPSKPTLSLEAAPDSMGAALRARRENGGAQ
jgi:DNA-binding XRE family transcriptional regulator